MASARRPQQQQQQQQQMMANKSGQFNEIDRPSAQKTEYMEIKLPLYDLTELKRRLCCF